MNAGCRCAGAARSSRPESAYIHLMRLLCQSATFTANHEPPGSLFTFRNGRLTAVCSMEARQWTRQWARLTRQEAELCRGLHQEAKQTAPGSSRWPGAPVDQVQQLRAQLDRQLAILEAMRSQKAAGEEAPALDRRCRQAGAVLAQLATACAAQLQELDDLEVQLSPEYEQAAERARQLLATEPAAAQHQRGKLSCASSSAAQQEACSAACGPAGARSGGSLPPEVAAHDRFLQRHGPTGESVMPW